MPNFLRQALRFIPRGNELHHARRFFLINQNLVDRDFLKICKNVSVNEFRIKLLTDKIHSKDSDLGFKFGYFTVNIVTQTSRHFWIKCHFLSELQVKISKK